MDKEIQGECAECQMVNSTVEKNTTEKGGRGTEEGSLSLFIGGSWKASEIR